MGVSAHRPVWRLLANQQDITRTIADRLVSIRYTDCAGIESDVLEIQLSDHDPKNPVRLPPTGAELDFSIGYDGASVRRVGVFVVDEIELGAPPAEMTIRARAAPFDRSRGGKTQLQTQKRRAWERGKKLGDVVKTIAAEHKLTPVVSPALAQIELPHLTQTDESDLNFLSRLAYMYDAVLKPAGGKLVLAKKGEGTTASGKPQPAITLRPADVTSWRATIAKREVSGTVIARWHATKQAKINEVKIGAGEPVTILKRYLQTEAMAQAAARAELEKRARRQAMLHVQMPGRTDAVAEGRLILQGFREGADGTWTVTRAEHTLDSGGYRTTVDAEWPTATATAATQKPAENAAGDEPAPAQ